MTISFFHFPTNSKNWAHFELENLNLGKNLTNSHGNWKKNLFSKNLTFK